MNIDNISRYAYLGRRDKDWYAECRKTLVDIFGEDELWLVTSLLAATSINSSLKSNITLFRKAYYEIKNNLPIGNYLPIIKSQIHLIRNCEDLSGRKINSFACAMRGDRFAVVVDIWITRAFGMDRQYKRLSGPHKDRMHDGGPTNKQYTIIESWIRQEAAYRQMYPAELCAMIWGGIRRERSGDNQTKYCDFLRQKLTNLFNVI